jgi:kinesin family protein 3/17
MEGVTSEPSMRGIIPNAFEHIFDHIALNRSNDKYLVRASYFEIYNEEILDLLSPSAADKQLELHESDTGAVFVKDLTDVVVKSVAEIDGVLQKGKKNRSVGATLMNAESSRSHSIFSIVVECCSSKDDQKDRIRVGKLNLVDLAGSERQSKTGATGDRLKEATKINLSLSALGNVISALVDGKSNHVPYRDSKLTRILQDSLGGNTKTVMCANAGPADYNYDESLSTLRYANRAKNIKNRPVINQDPKDAMLREYQDEITRLKERLSQMPSASNITPPTSAVSDADRETILKECRTKASKETEETIAKLKMNHDQSAEERAALQKKLEDEKKARLETERQRLDLQEKLRKMEQELMVGGEIASNAAKQEAALRIANQELIAKKETEAILARKMADKEAEKLDLEEKYSSLNDEVTSKTRKLKKVWSKYQQAKAEITDLEREFVNEKTELLDSVRELTRQLKLKAFVISKFIPPKVSVLLKKQASSHHFLNGITDSPTSSPLPFTLQYALLYDDVENGGRAVWNETEETWSIPRLVIQDGDINTIRERSMTSQSIHRPEIEYARQRRLVDPNPRWRTENVVDLERIMPTPSTPNRDDPNTLSKIRAILAMDLKDDTPSSNKTRKSARPITAAAK